MFIRKTPKNLYKNIADIISILFIIIFGISGILTLSKYGMTWDEGLGNFFFGERYLRYIATSNDNFLNFNEYLSMHKEHPLDLYKSPFRGSPHELEIPVKSHTHSGLIRTVKE